MEKYAIIDVETTGLSPKLERLTEIAIIIIQDGQIIDEYSSLINPEKSISYRITQLTGINNKLVQNAPKFYEIAKKVVEMTDDCTFVAHNASFDYRFIQAEFSRYGFDYQRKVLDTVKLSRKLLPGFRSYSLGKLTAQLGIEIKNRHRAMGDAAATAELFQLLLQKDPNLATLNMRGLNKYLKKEILDKLPNEVGVYYFFNEKNDLIYIGKSNNIYQRVISHLNNTSTRKAMEMREQIAAVDFELCGSELIALLLESDEIKRHLPVYNRAQRRTAYQWGIYSDINSQAYHSLKVDRLLENENLITIFSSKRAAVSELERLTEEFSLCQKINALYKNSGACFYYGIQQCNGACVGEESVEDYNQRVEKLIAHYQYDKPNFIIVDTGRNTQEKALVFVENNIYKGFGFVSVDELDQPIEVLKSFIKPYSNNRDVASIIRGYLKRKTPEAFIQL